MEIIQTAIVPVIFFINNRSYHCAKNIMHLKAALTKKKYIYIFMNEIRNITKFYKIFISIIILYPLHYVLNLTLTCSRIRNLSLHFYSSINLFSYMYVGREDPLESKILKKQKLLATLLWKYPIKIDSIPHISPLALNLSTIYLHALENFLEAGIFDIHIYLFDMEYYF